MNYEIAITGLYFVLEMENSMFTFACKNLLTYEFYKCLIVLIE